MKSSLIKLLNSLGFYRRRQIKEEISDEIREWKHEFITNYSPSIFLIEKFFQNLKLTNFKPRLMLDIGSHTGYWTRHFLKYFKDCECHMFEPQNHLHKHCSDITSLDNVYIHSLGIGETTEDKAFTYVERADSCTFNISKTDADKKGYKQETLKVITLNDFLDQNNLSKPNIIKIDAEGLDLAVLRGASSILGNTEIILLECSIGEVDSDNSIYNVIQFLHSKNYRVFEITDMIRSFGNTTWLCEICFILKGSSVDNFNFAIKN
jgi:FkbM family methyltransferase